MRSVALEHEHANVGQVYSVQKIKASLENLKLAEILTSIFC
jgi:hypothetical protein